MFDEKSIQELKFYVYYLMDPESNQPFYVGKGEKNRVFDHINEAILNPAESDKLNKIREIKNAGLKVKHVIARHGLSEAQALEIEATMIDSLNYFALGLTNKIAGHYSIDKGIMTTNEIIRLYNATPLNEISDDAIIININKRYQRGTGYDGIYNAVRECWPIGVHRRRTTKYVLAEYKGLIVEVFQIEGDWYPVDVIYKSGKRAGEKRVRWGFKGVKASDEIRGLYINKSIKHHKKRGASNPIRCNL